MSYTPTNWQSGDKITAAKLNKMEQGIAGGSNDVFTFIAEYANSNYTFDHTLDEIANAVANEKTIVCVVKWGRNIGYSFVEAYMDGDYAHIVVTPVINDTSSALKPFTIYYSVVNGYVCFVDQDDEAYIVPHMDATAHKHTVPMVSADDTLTFYPMNDIFIFENTIEQLVLASMQMSDVATVFSDEDMVANSSQVVSSAIEDIGYGRGVVAFHSFNSGLTNCGMFMTGCTETKDNDNNVLERTVYSNIDVVSTTTDQDGVYSGITTGHGTLTLTVNYEDGEPLSAMCAIHMDVHTPTVL